MSIGKSSRADLVVFLFGGHSFNGRLCYRDGVKTVEAIWIALYFSLPFFLRFFSAPRGFFFLPLFPLTWKTKVCTCTGRNWDNLGTTWIGPTKSDNIFCGHYFQTPLPVPSLCQTRTNRLKTDHLLVIVKLNSICFQWYIFTLLFEESDKSSGPGSKVLPDIMKDAQWVWAREHWASTWACRERLLIVLSILL